MNTAVLLVVLAVPIVGLATPFLLLIAAARGFTGAHEASVGVGWANGAASDGSNGRDRP